MSFLLFFIDFIIISVLSLFIYQNIGLFLHYIEVIMITNYLSLNSDREENLIRIFPDFPVSVYQTDFSDPAYQLVSWHWHEDFQLCLVERGKVCFQTPGSRLSISSGSGIFLNRRLVHSALPITSDASYYCINFSPALLTAASGAALSDAMVLPLLNEKNLSFFQFDTHTPDGSLLTESIRCILQLSEEHTPESSFQIYGTLFFLWTIVWGFLRQDESASNKCGDTSAANNRLKQIFHYLQTHYSQKITLRAISKEINLCPEECERFFKRMTGTTIFQYLLEYRIKKSQELLSDSRLSIAEIAQSSGFTTQSYYSSCFKRLTGCTPGAFRKEGASLPDAF